MKCPVCRGDKGWWQQVMDFADPTSSVEDWVKCATCNGTGMKDEPVSEADATVFACANLKEKE